MKYICHDCGYEIPDGMDFCPRCGCMRSKSTPVDDSTGMPLGVCPSCGASCNPGDAFCGACGAPLPQTRVMVPKLRKYGSVALILALVPGFFNIFGLGHLVMRSWSRGIMFLAISVVLFYVNGFSLFSTSFVMTLVCVMVYFYQAMDAIRIAYSPEAK